MKKIKNETKALVHIKDRFQVEVKLKDTYLYFPETRIFNYMTKNIIESMGFIGFMFWVVALSGCATFWYSMWKMF